MTPKRQMTTYSRADGDLIAGEYGWVTDLEYIEEDTAYVDRLDIVKETWQLVASVVLVYGALDRECAECDEPVTLAEPVDGLVYCPEHNPEEGHTVRVPKPENYGLVVFDPPLAAS